MQEQQLREENNQDIRSWDVNVNVSLRYARSLPTASEAGVPEKYRTNKTKTHADTLFTPKPKTALMHVFPFCQTLPPPMQLPSAFFYMSQRSEILLTSKATPETPS